MNEDNINIDYHGLLNMMADKVIADFLSAIAPDEQSRRLITGMISIHRKYGIDATTSFKIMQDIVELTKKEGLV